MSAVELRGYPVLQDTPNASLDVVIAFDVIEHFTKTEMISLVDEVHRVLKPSGRWVIHMPNAESPFGSRILFGDYTHEQAFTRTSLGQLLRSSGFARVDCFEDSPVPHGLKSVLRTLGWRVIRSAMLAWIVTRYFRRTFWRLLLKKVTVHHPVLHLSF